MSQEICDRIISKLENNLDIKIDRNSYDYDILKTISDFIEDSDNLTKGFINSYTFENLESRNLDNFLNFFDSYRVVGNNEDLYTIKLKYISNIKNSLNILKNCIIKFENSFYKVLKDTIINSEESILTVQKIFNITEIQEPLYSNKGTMCFDKKFVKSSMDVVLESEFPKNLYVLSIIRNPSEKESDFEFMEKSKNLLQSYGYSNLKKIELMLQEDKRIRSTYIVDSNGSTDIIIFPNKLSELDVIIEYNKNIVEFYKSSNINLVKPNLFEISVSDFLEQINSVANINAISETIITDLKITLSLLYSDTDSLILKRSDIIETLKNSVYKLNISDEIDYNSVNVVFKYFYKNNYNEHILMDFIRESIIINKSDLLTFGTLS